MSAADSTGLAFIAQQAGRYGYGMSCRATSRRAMLIRLAHESWLASHEDAEYAVQVAERSSGRVRLVRGLYGAVLIMALPAGELPAFAGRPCDHLREAGDAR